MIARRPGCRPGRLRVGLAACGEGRSRPPSPAAGVITFSILSTESAQNMEQYWKPILADMEKQTGLKVKPFFSTNYTALIEAMRFKQERPGLVFQPLRRWRRCAAPTARCSPAPSTRRASTATPRC